MDSQEESRSIETDEGAKESANKSKSEESQGRERTATGLHREPPM